MIRWSLDTEVKSWINIINTNLKWSVALLIRIITFGVIFFIFLFLARITGVHDILKKTLGSKSLQVSTEEITTISKPSIPKYENDYKDIDAVKQLIEQKLKEVK